MIDLHIHTSCSDGQFSPEATIALAYAAGVTTVAITDHDTTDGVVAASQAAQTYGMDFFPGIEISVKGEKELHILGYGIDPADPALLDFCRDFQQQREARALRIEVYLQDLGIPITLADVRHYSDGKSSGRPHFARALVEMGYADSVQDAFAKYLTTPTFYATIERPKPSPEEGLAVIRGAGGVAVLAHPYQLHLEADALEALVKRLVGYGLQGIEVYHSRHTRAQMEAYLALAGRLGLRVTCGSDYHGPAIKPQIQLGSGVAENLCITDQEIPQALRAAIKTLRRHT